MALQPYHVGIDLQKNTLANAKFQSYGTLPAVADYSGEIVEVAGKPYWSDGVEWHDMTSIDIDNVHVDTDNLTIAEFVTDHYTVGDEYVEGDMIILTNATDTGLRNYIHNGGAVGDVTDFTVLPSNISETFVREALSATGAIGYDVGTGVISLTLDAGKLEIVGGELTLTAASITSVELANDSVTKEKIAADVAGAGLAQNVDGSLEIAAGGVDTDELADESVTQAKLDATLAAKIVTSKQATFGDGAATSFTFTHNLNTPYVTVTCYNVTTGDEVTCYINKANDNELTIGAFPAFAQDNLLVIVDKKVIA